MTTTKPPVGGAAPVAVAPSLHHGDAPKAPRPPGLYDDVKEQDYHSDRLSLSVSGAKVLLKAPALFKWQQDHPVHKDVFDVGSAAHKLVLGAGDPIYVAPFDNWMSKAAKAERDAARAEHMIPLLPSDYETVSAMADALSSHTLAMTLLSDGKPEVSAYAIDEPTGVMRRGRFDWLGANYVADFKTTTDSDPDVFGGSAAKFGYDMQAAWYLALARDIGHPAAAFGFITQMKTPPYLVSVVELDADSIERGRRRNRRALEMFRDCTASNIWPGFQADGEITTVRLPRWAFYEEGM